MTPVEVTRGFGPIVLGMPHTGTFVPDDIYAVLNRNGRKLADTDWHIGRLYEDLLPDVTTVRATFHRYVIDANRDPSGQSLYPGQNTTTLVPLTDFDGQNIWKTPPTNTDIKSRQTKFHAPYHRALDAELQRVRAQQGVAILFDCHSIRSNIPFLFNGTLPDFNIGTNKGATCASQLQTTTERICADAAGYTSVSNGRFKGGWTTRHYGRPDTNQHAIQMEIAQSAYLKHETAPWSYDTVKAEKIRKYLRQILTGLNAVAPTLGASS